MIQHIVQFSGMIAVIFGAIYVTFTDPAKLPFTIGFNLDGTKALALFGLVGTSLKGLWQWCYRLFQQKVKKG